MEVEFMTADTTPPPCMPLPRAMLRLPISSTAKVMYARMLDIVFVSGIEDTNGILFIHFPIVELAAALARSTMTVKRFYGSVTIPFVDRFPRGEIYDLLTTKPEDAANGKQTE